MKICIDPGHSGSCEPGACGGGLTEASLVLYIARFTLAELELRGHSVRLTRDGPVDDAEIDWRTELANEWGADLFISIHCNSAVRIDAEGSETYHFPDSVKGRQLARCLQFCMTDAMLTEDRGVKEADFQVLRETNCPAALVECAFISNPVDREMLVDSLEQWRMGAAIAVAVCDYEIEIKKYRPEAFTDD